jgi:tetratricopeptide (TPR) repeat protein
MSWFVLHPPAGVAIVSFFVTGRWAGQNDRSAFIDNVVEQLASMLGEALPAFLTESNKETHLLALLADAAELCASRGEEFVLLVDGVDEDRGVTTEFDAHSILALLPPQGTRVILSGRPNPPVPPDVPDDHPVRRPDVRRVLAPSVAARTIRAETERELKALLRGTAVEQRLLGFVTASGGGLTSADLAELTGLTVWEVEDHLRTRTGRSFNRRPGRFDPEKDSYTLGHEELAVIAREALGERRLGECRDRIHAWAQGYADESWPTRTPEYFVSGYFALLAETGDTDRMVRYATDPARQERLLAMSGGDAAASTDLNATLESLPVDDLAARTRVAVHRDHLVDRNADVSSFLPMAWIAVGRGPRALQLALSIGAPARRLTALLHVATAAALDEHTTAEAVTHAVALVDTVRDYYLEHGQAEEVAAALAGPGTVAFAPDDVVRTKDIDDVTKALVEAGEADQAVALLETYEAESTEVSWSWSRLAGRLHGAGEHELAEKAFRRAEARIVGESNHLSRSDMWSMVAIVRASIGDTEKAVAVIDRAIADAREATGHTSDERYRTALAKAAANAGNLALAQAMSSDVVVEARDASHRSHVDDLLAVGDLDNAITQALSITRDGARGAALVRVTRALAAAGDAERAEPLARRITDVGRQRQAFVGIVAELTAAREEARASTALDRVAALTAARGDAALASMTQELARAGLFDAAEQTVAAITDEFQRNRAAVTLVACLVDAGQLDRAESWVATVVVPPARCAVLCAMAHSLLLAGQDDRAAEPLAEAVRLARANVTSIRWRHEVVMVVEALAIAGRTDEATVLGSDLADPALSAQALATVGELAESQDIFDLALKRMAAVTDEDRRVVVAHRIARSLAAVEAWARAEDLGRATTAGLDEHPVALTVAEELVAAGQYERAEAYALSFDEPQTRSLLLRPLTWAADSDRARRAIGRSLALSRWHLSIPAAAAIEPPCLAAAIEELSRLRPDAWADLATSAGGPRRRSSRRRCSRARRPRT